MTDSSLITSTILSPNFTKDRIDDKNGNRQGVIDTITPHCTAGNKDSKATSTANGFADPNRQASSNYVIGGAGDVCLVVHEKDRSWCSGGEKNVKGETGRLNDFHAVTIEVASDTSGDHVNETAFNKLKELCVDIMKRNGKTKAIWFGDDAEKMVIYQPAADEMKFTWHRWFAKKACPGKYIMDHMQELIDYCNAAFAEVQPEPQPAPTPAPVVTNDIEVGDTVKINADAINKIINDVNTKLLGPLTVCKTAGSMAQLDLRVEVPMESLTEISAEAQLVSCNPYIVKVKKVLPLPIYNQPKSDAKQVGSIDNPGTYTIIAQTTDLTFGKLKSGAGYIRLADVDKA